MFFLYIEKIKIAINDMKGIKKPIFSKMFIQNSLYDQFIYFTQTRVYQAEIYI